MDEKIATGSLGDSSAVSLDAQGEFLEWTQLQNKFLVKMGGERRDTASALHPPPPPSQGSCLDSVEASCSSCSWQQVLCGDGFGREQEKGTRV